MNVPDRLRHQDRPPVPARANQNASRAKADQLQWQFRRGAESKEGGVPSGEGRRRRVSGRFKVRSADQWWANTGTRGVASQ